MERNVCHSVPEFSGSTLRKDFHDKNTVGRTVFYKMTKAKKTRNLSC